MPRLSRPDEIRRLLETDRPWSVYALGDLSPGFFEKSEWYVTDEGPAGEPALALLYRAFDTPVLFTLGPAGPVRQALDEISGEPEMYLSVRPEILPLVKERYEVRQATPMWRMILPPAAFRPVPDDGTARLAQAGLPALRALYEDGRSAGEAPDFFSALMLEQGVFYGLWEGGELMAAAGTHLVSPQESVGAVGNVYTRRDRRGRGLAARATSAVTAELTRLGLRTIALNVDQSNAAAIRVYERLGYQKYCAFFEGLAIRT